MGSAVAVHGAEVLLPWVLYREREHAIFTSVCATTKLRFKAEHQRGVWRGASSSPYDRCGLDKGPPSMLGLRDPFLISDFETCSHSH